MDAYGDYAFDRKNPDHLKKANARLAILQSYDGALCDIPSDKLKQLNSDGLRSDNIITNEKNAENTGSELDVNIALYSKPVGLIVKSELYKSGMVADWQNIEFEDLLKKGEKGTLTKQEIEILTKAKEIIRENIDGYKQLYEISNAIRTDDTNKIKVQDAAFDDIVASFKNNKVTIAFDHDGDKKTPSYGLDYNKTTKTWDYHR